MYDKFTVGDGCWEWTAARNVKGYGQVRHMGRTCLAHRVLWEQMNGPVPKGLELDHLCRNRACVRPDHLEAVTHRENCRRGIVGAVSRARILDRTHCKNGHEFSGANLGIRVRKDGSTYRGCRACGRLKEQRRIARIKEQAA